MTLNPEKIANTAKAAGIDPKIVFKNLFIQTAYNSQHQRQIANEVSDLIQSNKNIKLIVVNNVTKFFQVSSGHNRPEIANSIKEVISTINRACAKNKVAIVATGNSNVRQQRCDPKTDWRELLEAYSECNCLCKEHINECVSSKFQNYTR